MTLREFALRLIPQLQPMAVGLAAAAIVSFAAVIAIFLLCRRSWLQDKGFRILGLFFGLGTRDIFRLASCWVKMVLVIVFVAMFQVLAPVQYFMVLLAGLVSVALDYGLLHRLEDLFWLLLQMVGLVASNLLCRFVLERSGSREYVWIYGGMGLFLALFSLYLFLNELVNISACRQIDAREVWEVER